MQPYDIDTLQQRIARLNWPLAGLAIILGAIGVVMMLSVGGGDFATYAMAQSIRFGLALGLMFFVALVPLRMIMRLSYLLYFLCIGALLVVEVIGHTGMGAQRWVRFAGVTIQPSEFAKLAVILALARYYHMLALEDTRKFLALVLPVVLLLLPTALIVIQPNLGTAVVTLATGALLMFLAGVSWRYFIAVGVAATAAAPIGWTFLHDYQRQRVMTFINPEQDPLGSGYNIIQSMIAIGSGGFLGKGYLQGTQGRLNFLPEKHTDFVFTVLAEEWGFLGSVLLLGLYLLLLFTALSIAIASRNTFGALVAGGVGALLFLHMFINIAMVMGLLPVVGLPLPFLSYGGSIMLSTLIGVGLMLNADLHRDKQVLERADSIR